MPAKYYVDDEYGRRSIQSLDEDQAKKLKATPVDKPAEKPTVKRSEGSQG
jgi:hypothetical protein